MTYQWQNGPSFVPFSKPITILPRFLPLAINLLPILHRRRELRFLLRKQVYSMWQQARESSDTDSIMRFLFILVKDRASFPFELKFFLTQALTGHGCLYDYLFRYLSLSFLFMRQRQLIPSTYYTIPHIGNHQLRTFTKNFVWWWFM